MARSDLEKVILKPHERHPDPHPQYALKSDGGTLSDDTPSPIGVDDAGSPGTSTEGSRADHVHASPPLATTTTAGLMSPADKAALSVLVITPPVTPVTPEPTDLSNYWTKAESDQRFYLYSFSLIDVDNGGFWINVDTLSQIWWLPYDDPLTAPTVDAGIDASGDLTGYVLTGSVSGDTTDYTFSWYQDSGPGTVTFSDATSPTATITADLVGDYVLRYSGINTYSTVAEDSVTITMADNKNIFIVGNFTTVGGVSCPAGIAKVNASTGAIVTAFNANYTVTGGGAAITNVAYDSALNVLYACGSFSSIGGNARTQVCAFDGTTGTLLAWAPVITVSGFNVLTIRVFNSIVYIGGTFGSVNATTRAKLAAIDSSGVLTSWNPDANGTVRWIGLDSTNSLVYVIGDFGSFHAGADIRGNLAALAITAASTVQPLTVTTDGIGYRVADADGDGLIYFAGNFNTINGTTVNAGCSVDSTGAVQMFKAGSNVIPVQPITTSTDNVYYGNTFTTIDGVARVAVASKTKAGALRGWNAALPGSSNVHHIFVRAGKVYIGGSFTSAGGSTRAGIAAFTEAGALLAFDALTNGTDCTQFEWAQ